LESLLSNLSEELANIRDEVEVCVSDNASNDSTREVLEKFSRIVPLRYGTNERNLGYDLNTIKVTGLATGSYVWYTGDDDLFLPGSVKRMLTNIKKNAGKDIGAIFVNAQSGNKPLVGFGFNGFRIFPSDSLPPLHPGLYKHKTG
jgi:abequosyltransferase